MTRQPPRSTRTHHLFPNSTLSRSLEVARRPTVAVFTTGDELVEPGLPLAPGQIYNSNREQLMGLLRADGLEPVAWPTLPDDPAQVESALRHAGNAFDVRSEEHTSELQSLMRYSYAVFCLKKKNRETH